MARQREAGASKAPALTVRSAVEAYIAARGARSAAAGADARLRLNRHVLEAPCGLADLPLAKVTEGRLADWRTALARGGRQKEKAKKVPSAAPLPPLAPATVARLLNDLRAALNVAGRRHRKLLPADFRQEVEAGTRPPEGADRAREAPQVLSDADLRALLAACEEQGEDFGALTVMLAATGARFSQLARVTVSDVQTKQGRVMVPTSAKGRGGKKASHTAVQIGPDVLARLHPLLAGRKGHEPLFTRWHHKQVGYEAGRSVWARSHRAPWTNAAELSRPWRAALLVAGLPSTLIPYALRHTSIVRGLRAGLPVRLVAALHDTSAAMIEKHYSAFIVDAAEDLARRAITPLVSAAPVRLQAVAS